MFFFFFQAEDGIRDHCVTGVQTCALPITLRNQPTPSPLTWQSLPKKSSPKSADVSASPDRVYFTGWKVLSAIALRIQRIKVIALNSAKNVVPFASSMGIAKLYLWSWTFT